MKHSIALLCALTAFFLLPAMTGPGPGNKFRAPDDAYPPGYYPDDPLPPKTAYLTFDDGPSDWTAEILNILKREGISATFFVCGDWAPRSNRMNNDFKKYAPVLIRMIREGHVLGNHTIDHKNLAVLGPEAILRQIDENQELLNRELKGDAVPMTLIRPPFGSPWHDSTKRDALARVGRVLRTRGPVILWSRHFDSSDSKEWVRGEWYQMGPRIYMGSPEFKKKMHRIYVRLIEWAKGDGMVILFHDTHPTTLEILTSVIDRLKQEGYRFRTMEDYVKWRYGKSSREMAGR